MFPISFSGHMDEIQGQTADTNFVLTVSWPSCFEAAKLDTVIVLREKMYLFDFQVIVSKVKVKQFIFKMSSS